MSTITMTLDLPEDVYRIIEHGAAASHASVPDYVRELIATQARSAEDALAIEGYQLLADETLDFAASALATVRSTWPRWDQAAPARKRASHRASSPGTCRAEILSAIQALVARTGRPTFEMQEVVDEMRRRGTRYAVSTIRTQIGSTMCANAPVNHGVVYEDLERIDHGLYRLAAGAEGTGDAE